MMGLTGTVFSLSLPTGHERLQLQRTLEVESYDGGRWHCI